MLVLIVGGGIAGLTTAIALRQYGIDSLVFEQADDLHKTQVGPVSHLSYNATRAFNHLDLLDELAGLAAPVGRFEFRTRAGKHLGTTPQLEGELALGVIRPVFHDFLVNVVGEDEVQVGAKLVRFDQDDDAVTAHFADGRRPVATCCSGSTGCAPPCEQAPRRIRAPIRGVLHPPGDRGIGSRQGWPASQFPRTR